MRAGRRVDVPGPRTRKTVLARMAGHRARGAQRGQVNDRGTGPHQTLRGQGRCGRPVFTVEPGKITGFLGPNGAGKTTTMRLILGLDRPTAGTRDRQRQAVPPSSPTRCARSARCSTPRPCTAAVARTTTCLPGPDQQLPAPRVDEVLDLVGLSEVARKRSKGFSLGMGQRLGIAAALLGDPAILMFDEPVNGLDPEGILWIRNLMKALAAEGRTVFVSSHLMSEMENTADHLLVIGRGTADRRLHRGRVHRRATRCRRSGSAPRSARRCAARSRWPAARRRRPRTARAWCTGLAADQIGDLAFEQRHPAARAGPGARPRWSRRSWS